MDISIVSYWSTVIIKIALAIEILKTRFSRDCLVRPEKNSMGT